MSLSMAVCKRQKELFSLVLAPLPAMEGLKRSSREVQVLNTLFTFSQAKRKKSHAAAVWFIWTVGQRLYTPLTVMTAGYYRSFETRRTLAVLKGDAEPGTPSCSFVSELINPTRH